LREKRKREERERKRVVQEVMHFCNMERERKGEKERERESPKGATLLYTLSLFV